MERVGVFICIVYFLFVWVSLLCKIFVFRNRWMKNGLMDGKSFWVFKEMGFWFFLKWVCLVRMVCYCKYIEDIEYVKDYKISWNVKDFFFKVWFFVNRF